MTTQQSWTHVSLDGGSFSSINHSEYIQNVLAGVKMFMCEKRDVVFRFYLDFDYSSRDSNEMDFLSIFKIVSKLVNGGTCYISRAKSRVLPDNSIKYGFHLIWPNLHVRIKTAETIRQRVLNDFGDDWLKIFDKFSSGLRMLWSYKTETGSTFYEPWGILNEDGSFNEFDDKNPSVEFLEMFTIKSQENIPESNSQRIDFDKNALERYIQNHFIGQENARVLNCNVSKNGTGLWFSTNSRFCGNISREHKSNHVYFVVQNGIIKQKCLDQECKDYTSRGVVLPKSIKDLCCSFIK